MSTPMPGAPAKPADAHPVHPLAPGSYQFLAREITAWRSDGLIDDELARTLLTRYRPTRRLSLARLILGLGAAFLGFGVIWLIAANLDRLSPVTRFALITIFWLICLAGAEWLATRRAHRGTIPSPVVGAARGVAALAFGGVVFQAAQSLQVPAFEPRLVAVWSAGALLQAYLFRGYAPLVIGVLTAAFWLVSSTTMSSPDALSALLAILGAGVVGSSVAVLHHRFLGDLPGAPGGVPPGFAAPWRTVASGLTLIGVFVAAIPGLPTEEFTWRPRVVAILVIAGLAVAAALLLTRGRDRWEPLAAVAALLLGVALASWHVGTDSTQIGIEDWLHAGLAVIGYVLVAGWIAVLGVLRDEDWLTWIATAALVIFTTFQSFAVFAQIIQGAWLFVLLGVVFLITGFAFDRARREVVASLEGAQS